MSKARAGRVKRPTSFLPLQTLPVLEDRPGSVGWADALMGPWKSRQSSRTSFGLPTRNPRGKREASRPLVLARAHVSRSRSRSRSLCIPLHNRCHGRRSAAAAVCTASAIWSRSGIREGQAFLCCCQSPDGSGAHQLIGGRRPETNTNWAESCPLPPAGPAFWIIDRERRKTTALSPPSSSQRTQDGRHRVRGLEQMAPRSPVPRRPRGQALEHSCEAG